MADSKDQETTEQAIKYFLGQNVPCDLDKAYQIFSHLAEKGDANAQFHAAFCRWYGLGTAEDKPAGAELNLKAAQQGHPLAIITAAGRDKNTQFSKKDIEIAFDNMTAQANDGDAFAQLRLGLCNDNGFHVSVDKARASEWYLMSASQGHLVAAYNIGWNYENGEGLDKNLDEALSWYKQAAAKGHVGAQNNLGTMFYSGEGVSVDHKESAMWFQKAAEGGNASGQFNLGAQYYKGEGIEKDQEKAFKWFEKAANKKHTTAMYWMGVCYHKGHGTKKDLHKGLFWYESALKNGSKVVDDIIPEVKQLIKKESVNLFWLGWYVNQPKDPQQEDHLRSCLFAGKECCWISLLPKDTMKEITKWL